jgi:putative redox protein
MEKILLTTSVELLNDKFKFSGIARDNQPIQVDYNKPMGDGEGYTSLELFLISLSTCSASSIVFLVRKMNKTIKTLKVSAIGERRTEHPTCFSSITLSFDIYTDALPQEIDHAIKLSEEKFCPVWAMIKNNVEVKIGYTLNNISI